jgi:hypothetical protein
VFVAIVYAYAAGQVAIGCAKQSGYFTHRHPSAHLLAALERHLPGRVYRIVDERAADHQ